MQTECHREKITKAKKAKERKHQRFYFTPQWAFDILLDSFFISSLLQNGFVLWVFLPLSFRFGCFTTSSSSAPHFPRVFQRHRTEPGSVGLLAKRTHCLVLPEFQELYSTERASCRRFWNLVCVPHFLWERYKSSFADVPLFCRRINPELCSFVSSNLSLSKIYGYNWLVFSVAISCLSCTAFS